MNKLCVICDLDGTLYNAKTRQEKYLLSGKKDFDGFHAAAIDDPIHLWCAEIIKGLSHRNIWTYFVSGRDDEYRDATQLWIKQKLLWAEDVHYKLLMRPTGDYTADDVVKEKWLKEKILPNFEVLCAIDDRKRVADMWRRNGITCLQCEEGNF